MKKNFLFGMFAMAAFTMVGCSQDEAVVDHSPENAIQFGTYLGRNAEGRGTILTDNNLLDFGVFASYTGQYNWSDNNNFNFMFNQIVSRTSNTADWAYTPLKYWPTTKNDKITFFAYSPYADNTNGAISVVSTNKCAGIPQIKYTIKPDYLNEAEDFTADVLYDEIREGNGTSIDSEDRTVAFTLAHELTRLNFKAKLDRNAFVENNTANQTKVNIKAITFGGTKYVNEATYTFATSENTRGTWTLGTSAQTLNLDKLLNSDETSIGGYTTKGVKVTNTTAVDVFNTNAYLFLIPLNGESGLANAGDITITVDYDIVTIDNNLSAGYSCTNAVKTFELPQATLKQGTAYLYTLTFGLNEIKLSASVSDWVEDTYSEDVDWTLQK